MALAVALSAASGTTNADDAGSVLTLPSSLRSTSHTRTVRSAPPLSRTVDSLLKASASIRAMWPTSVLIARPVPMSQSLIVRSSLPLAR